MTAAFQDRREAGQRLAEAMASQDLTNVVVLALPRGGVPVAAPVAQALGAPLDLLLVRKIGAPGQPELAVAAVADGADPVLACDDETMALTGASPQYIQRELPAHLREIERRRKLYLKGRPPIPLAGKTAVLVDDGIATGTTVRAALMALRLRGPARVILAVPVASQEALHALRPEVDALVCLETPAWFGAVGAHYRYFPSVSDDEVVALMDEPSGAH